MSEPLNSGTDSHTHSTLKALKQKSGAQREHAAAPGGAAQAGSRRGEDQGLSGGCRASTVLHTECLQGSPAGRCSSQKQPLSGAQILCFTLKTVGKKSAEECFQAPSDE